MTGDDFLFERRRMVADQIAARGVLEPRLLAVMESLPRHLFVPPDDLAYAYADGPLPIGHGQTISQPYIVALMTELLELEPGDRALEVGTGSGYQAAVLGRLAAEVHTVERIPELAERARRTLAGLDLPHVYVHLGDGSLGWPQAAPYQAILVAAAAPSMPPPLLHQLADGGRMVIPVAGLVSQQLQVWTRSGEKCTHRNSLSVAFVPLRGEHGYK
jgi:protein-L-isoaspartate(D-aspartate) O-methyltransferase